MREGSALLQGWLPVDTAVAACTFAIAAGTRRRVITAPARTS